MVDFNKKLREQNNMASKETKTKEDVKTPEVIDVGQTGMATAGSTAVSTERRSFIDSKDRTGTEDIGLNDIRLPRLAIAQGLSYQMLPDDSRYIKGLTLFEMFNDLTSEIYGRGPMKFIPLLREVHIIEFDPENRGVPLDLNVPPNDPRTRWTKDPNGGPDRPPRATKYVDFVSMLIHADRKPEPIVISIKCTNKYQTRAAERLDTFIKLQDCPIYGAYKFVESKSEKNDEGTFGVFVVNNGKRLDAPDQTDEEWAISSQLYQALEAFHASLKGKRIVVDREPGDDTDFNPADLEGQPAGASAPRM